METFLSFTLTSTTAQLHILTSFSELLHGTLMSSVGSKKRTVGAFWLNAAETWVDVTHSKADKVVVCIIDELKLNRRDYINI